MNAADVLAEAADNHRIGSDSVPEFTPPLEKMQTAALLSHGGQGVAILPDGTLWALSKVPSAYHYEHFTLSPLSAEAGDTDD